MSQPPIDDDSPPVPLLTAAPDMYAALRALVLVFYKRNDMLMQCHSPELDALAAACKALGKARGFGDG